MILKRPDKTLLLCWVREMDLFIQKGGESLCHEVMEQDPIAKARVQEEAWAAGVKEEERTEIAQDQDPAGYAYVRAAVQLLNTSDLSPAIRLSALSAEPKC